MRYLIILLLLLASNAQAVDYTVYNNNIQNIAAIYEFIDESSTLCNAELSIKGKESVATNACQQFIAATAKAKDIKPLCDSLFDWADIANKAAKDDATLSMRVTSYMNNIISHCSGTPPTKYSGIIKTVKKINLYSGK